MSYLRMKKRWSRDHRNTVTGEIRNIWHEHCKGKAKSGIPFSLFCIVTDRNRNGSLPEAGLLSTMLSPVSLEEVWSNADDDRFANFPAGESHRSFWRGRAGVMAISSMTLGVISKETLPQLMPENKLKLNQA